VFATRILVDLVFLAALLQALSISARNATQRGLFYEGQLDRLDPFLEPREFRKLMRRGEKGRLEPDPARVAAFPEYDPIRLSELAGDDDRGRVFRAAVNAVRVQQGGSNVAEFHTELARRIHMPERDKIAILEVVNAIRAAGPERDIVLLDQLRRELNHVPKLIEVRTAIVRLIAEAPDSAEKTAALTGAIEHDRDSLGPVRLAALTGLAEAAQRGDRDAAVTLQRAISSQSLTKAEQRSARALLAQIDRGVPLARPAAPAPSRPAAEPPPPATEPEPEQNRDHQSHDPQEAEFEAPSEPPPPPVVQARREPDPEIRAAASPSPRRRGAQATMEWAALITFALVGAGWIYFWQNTGAFDR